MHALRKLAALTGLLLSAAAAVADTESAVISESQIKAAFLYNFTKFVEWPSERFASADDPIVIGVLGADTLRADLEAIVQDRKVNGRAIVVTSVDTAGEISAVHLLFVSESEDARFATLNGSVRDSAVLTVGESSAFAAAGGVICFVQEDSKLRFQINIASAERARLKISGELQKLATAVKRT